MNKWLILLALFVSAGFISIAEAARIQRTQVADPFIELHSGPGVGFPIFHVVERHEWIEIIKRKTDFIKVRTVDGLVGWVFIDQLEQTLVAPGTRLKVDSPTWSHFQQRTWYIGVMAGDFEGATAISSQVGWNFTDTMSAELLYEFISGKFTTSRMYGINFLSTPFPDWSLSPFFIIGAGQLTNSPRRSFVFAKETTDGFASAGFGVRYYLTRRAYFRAEYKDVTVLIRDENNGNFTEWKLGFSFFF